MAAQSGKNGTAKIGGVDITDLKNWSADVKGNTKAYASNSAPGAMRRVGGNFDYDVTFEVVTNPAGVLDAQTTFTAVLYLDTSTIWKTIPLIVDSVAAKVNIDSGDINSWTVKCSGNGLAS